MRRLPRAVPGMALPESDLIIVRDPSVLDGWRYSLLVALLGDLVRSEGGIGLELVRSTIFGGEIPDDDET